MPDLDGPSRDALVWLVLWQARQNSQLKAIVEKLAVANADLTAANGVLADRLGRVEHLLSRNSANSSSPPSKDDEPGRTPPKGKAPRVGAGARTRGGQPGASGSHLAFTDAPDGRLDRFPEGTCGCGTMLGGAVGRGEAVDLGIVDRYQQTEIPLVTATVTQYDQHAVRCRCGKVHTAPRPDGARAGPVGYGPNLMAWCVYLMVVHHIPVARVVELLTSLTGAAPSAGFVHSLITRTAAGLAEADARIRALICLAAIVVMDETPLRVGPRLPRPGRKKAEKYLLVAATALYTRFELGDRDLATFRASVLLDLARAGATVVHDRYHLYDHPTFAAGGDPADRDLPDSADHEPDKAVFAGLLHQVCTAHLQRDLTGAAEVHPDETWPEQIAEALRGLVHHTNLARHDAARAAGHDPAHCRYCQPDQPPVGLDELRRRFRQGVLVGLARTTEHGTRPGERKARLLLEFLHDREQDVLRFLTNLDIPPTSNDAERALRPSKIQQNISGRLTSETVTQHRYTVLGYLVTAAKHGRAMMTTLREAIAGRPWIPALPAPT
jgi:hypothetical protein